MNDDMDEMFDLQSSIEYIFEITGFKCHFCDNEAWAHEVNPGVRITSNDPQDPPTVLVKQLDASGSARSYMPTLTMTCTRCGFVRQHNLTWLKKEMRRRVGE